MLGVKNQSLYIAVISLNNGIPIIVVGGPQSTAKHSLRVVHAEWTSVYNVTLFLGVE